MKKLVVLLCALLALGSSAQALEVSAPSALLMEKETGTVLFAKDEHAKLEPASVTKVMTLLLTMEAIDAGQLHYDDVVTASAHACSMGGSQIWLKENEQMTVSDMLKAVCVVSANDCAVALAETVAGSEEAFVERMNQRAAELGMADTHFCKCHRPAGGGACHLRIRHRPYEPGTDPKPPGHPPVHHHLDGFPAGRSLLPGEHQPPDPLLPGSHRPEDRLNRQCAVLPLWYGRAGRHGTDRRHHEGAHLRPAL